MRSSVVILASAALLGGCVCESAIRTARHVVLRPEPELEPFDRALEAADAHDWSAALEWLRQAEAEHPEQVAIARERVVHARWIERGELCDFEWLERRIHARLDHDPRELAAWAELARLHLDRAVRDDDPSALRQVALILADADRIATDSAELELVRGLHAQLEGRHDHAFAAWQRAVEIDPTLAEARLRLGIACLEHRDHVCAEAALHEYVELEPADADGWLALGVAYARTDATKLARAAYQHAATLAPEDPRPHWNLAWLVDDDASDWDQHITAREHHLADMFAIVRSHPLPDCEAVLEPDPQCIARVEAHRQMLIDANEEMDVLHELLQAPPLHERFRYENRRIQAADEAAEKERRKKLLEMERAADGLENPPADVQLDVQPQVEIVEPVRPRRAPVDVEALGEPPGQPCSIR